MLVFGYWLAYAAACKQMAETRKVYLDHSATTPVDRARGRRDAALPDGEVWQRVERASLRPGGAGRGGPGAARSRGADRRAGQ